MGICEECGVKIDSDESANYGLCWDCYIIEDWGMSDY